MSTSQTHTGPEHPAGPKRAGGDRENVQTPTGPEHPAGPKRLGDDHENVQTPTGPEHPAGPKRAGGDRENVQTPTGPEHPAGPKRLGSDHENVVEPTQGQETLVGRRSWVAARSTNPETKSTLDDGVGAEAGKDAKPHPIPPQRLPKLKSFVKRREATSLRTLELKSSMAQ
jgi:hypothetical protein